MKMPNTTYIGVDNPDLYNQTLLVARHTAIFLTAFIIISYVVLRQLPVVFVGINRVDIRSRSTGEYTIDNAFQYLAIYSCRLRSHLVLFYSLILWAL